MSGEAGGLGLLVAFLALVVGVFVGRGRGGSNPGPTDEEVERAADQFQREQAARRRDAERAAAVERAELEARRASDTLDERVDDLLSDPGTADPAAGGDDAGGS